MVRAGRTVSPVHDGRFADSSGLRLGPASAGTRDHGLRTRDGAVLGRNVAIGANFAVPICVRFHLGTLTSGPWAGSPVQDGIFADSYGRASVGQLLRRVAIGGSGPEMSPSQVGTSTDRRQVRSSDLRAFPPRDSRGWSGQGGLGLLCRTASPPSPQGRASVRQLPGREAIRGSAPGMSPSWVETSTDRRQLRGSDLRAFPPRNSRGWSGQGGLGLRCRTDASPTPQGRASVR